MSIKQTLETVKTVSKSPAALAMGGVAMAFLFSDAAYAGGGGMEFDEVWTTLREWTTGTLGKIVAGAMILVGIIAGIARQSLMAFAIGIAGGMGLNYAPDIIENIMSATLEKAPTLTPAVIQFSNGLGG
jgi:conjugal transfer pilus assembly protein TraA